jgi:hypothetical protein
MVIDTGLDVPKARPRRSAWLCGPAGPAWICVPASPALHVIPRSIRKPSRLFTALRNTDLQAGLILALASNSASFFAHADIEELRPLMKDPKRTVDRIERETSPLPDPQALEDAVDAAFLKWPPGTL